MLDRFVSGRNVQGAVMAVGAMAAFSSSGRDLRSRTERLSEGQRSCNELSRVPSDQPLQLSLIRGKLSERVQVLPQTCLGCMYELRK